MKHLIPLALTISLVACGGGSTAPEPEALPSMRDLDPIVAAEQAGDPASSALASASRSSDAAVRARAARAYGRILKPASVEPLMRLVDDESPTVKGEALFAMGQFGWNRDFSGGREAELLNFAVRCLDDGNAGVRARAVEAAGKLAYERTPEVVGDRLKDADPSVRAEALMALYRGRLASVVSGRVKAPDLPALPESTVAAVLALEGDESPVVRRNVAYLFARVKEPRAVEACVRRSKDSDLWVRMFAVMALGRSGDVKAAGGAVGVLEDGEYLVRLAGVQALAGLQRADMIPAALAEDPSLHVRAAVASALGGEKGNAALLGRLAGDASPTVRAAAIGASASRLKSDAKPLVERSLADDSWVIREAAAQACGPLGEAGRPLLERALSDADERVRAAAVEVAGGQEGEWGLEIVKRALAADGLVERGTAVDVLGRRKEADRLELAWSTYQACGDRRWIEVREGLVDLMAGVPSAETTRYLRMMARDPAPSVAAKAIRTLKERGEGDLPAVPPLDAKRTPHAALRFTKNPIVAIETNKGSFDVEVLADQAPVHAASFVGLVKQGFYDGLIWHRVVPSFVIQGGDPTGTGWGDAGWSLRAEMSAATYARGTLGMPRSQGWDTGSCQLFFTHVPTPHLDSQYTVFGRIVSGVEVVDEIEKGDVIIRARVE